MSSIAQTMITALCSIHNTRFPESGYIRIEGQLRENVNRSRHNAITPRAIQPVEERSNRRWNCLWPPLCNSDKLIFSRFFLPLHCP
jgi:hypothetical protein